MPCRAYPRLVAQCTLSEREAGCAHEAQLFTVGSFGGMMKRPHTLVEGDYLGLRIRLPGEPIPLSIQLATVTWTRGNRFGVELLLMDHDERIRLNRFLDSRFPIEMEFQDSRTELTITATEWSPEP